MLEFDEMFFYFAFVFFPLFRSATYSFIGSDLWRKKCGNKLDIGCDLVKSLNLMEILELLLVNDRKKGTLRF